MGSLEEADADLAMNRAADLSGADITVALNFHRMGRLREAKDVYENILDREPNNIDALHLLGVAHYQTGDLRLAAEFIQKSVDINPTSALVLNNLGNVLKDLKKFDEAVATYGQAIALDPEYADAYFNRGVACQESGRFEDALASYNAAIARRTDHAEALVNRGSVLRVLNRLQESVASYDKAIALNPFHAAAYNNRGIALHELKRFDDAVASFKQAIAINPQYADAYNNWGSVLQAADRPEEALVLFNQAIFLNPAYIEAYCNRAIVLKNLHRLENAVESYDHAIALKSDHAEAHNNRGVILQDLKRLDGALASFEKAIEANPNFPEAYVNSGVVLSNLKRHRDAASRFEAALTIDPQFPFAKGMLLHEKMLCCDWSAIDPLISGIERDIDLGKPVTQPFGWHAISNSEKSLQLCAQIYDRQNFNAGHRTSPAPRKHHSKIRIGYLSGEFRDHATSHLLAGLFERHGKSDFEICLIDNGWDDQSEVRQRVATACDHIVEIGSLPDREAIEEIRSREIDILVNLNGYSGKHRNRIFAQRCSPIQINYLGFPGTMGTNYMDYIFADRIVIPEASSRFYSENIVYLPNCYQANDNKKQIASVGASRGDSGLPEQGFVFCCFNYNYKITPQTFDSWIRILKKVDGSVLWLLADNEAATGNLREHARLRGMDPERLVFAPRMPLAQHLARHRLAGLFLDTSPYNAHTTASDALWAGLPVLTCFGQTFAGRVAASLLTAIGLPELIAKNRQEYEDLAQTLATDAAKLQAVKIRLANNRLRTPLFDTGLFTSHMEEAYRIIDFRQRSGLPPGQIVVGP